MQLQGVVITATTCFIWLLYGVWHFTCRIFDNLRLSDNYHFMLSAEPLRFNAREMGQTPGSVKFQGAMPPDAPRSEDPGVGGLDPQTICRRGQSMFWPPKMLHSFIRNCCWITLHVYHHQGWKMLVKMEAKSNFSRRLKQFDVTDKPSNCFDGLTWLTPTPIFYDTSTLVKNATDWLQDEIFTAFVIRKSVARECSVQPEHNCTKRTNIAERHIGV